MPKNRKKVKKLAKLAGDARVIDLLERIGAIGLYLGTDFSQNDIAKKLRMDINRVNEILKKLKKSTSIVAKKMK